MDKDKLMGYFESTTPGDEQKSRMRRAILSHQHGEDFVPKRKRKWGLAKISASAVCLLIASLLLTYIPFGGETVAYGINIIDSNEPAIKLEDNENTRMDFGTSVSNVNSRPDLRFFINGEDIAKIEITTDTEYIHAQDWTETQHRKYWDHEYMHDYDEETQQYVLNADLIYDKQLTMTFDEDFTDYDQIWFRWVAWDLYQWAAKDDFAHFLGVGKVPENLSEEEKLEIAAGNGSGAGHIQLNGYPERLREDTVTITITDRNGEETTQVIHVKVSNNELRQTVVTATLSNQ